MTDKHTQKRKEPKHNAEVHHQITKEGKRRKKKNYKNNPETINKMALSKYLSIITLNLNGLNFPIKRQSG